MGFEKCFTWDDVYGDLIHKGEKISTSDGHTFTVIEICKGNMRNQKYIMQEEAG